MSKSFQKLSLKLDIVQYKMNLKKLRRISTVDNRLAASKFMQVNASQGAATERNRTQTPTNEYSKKLPKLAHMSSNIAVELLHLRKSSGDAESTRECASTIRKKLLEANDKII